MCALFCDGRPQELSQQRSPLVVLAPLLGSAVREGSCRLRAGSPPICGLLPVPKAPPAPARVLTVRKPRGGRQESPKCDGTGRSGQIRAVAGEGASREAGGKGG